MMKKHLLSIPLIVLTGLFIYGATIRYPFHWDDYRTIVDNPALADPFNLQNVFSFWPTRSFLFWTFAWNTMAGSYRLITYHLTNIAIHISAAIILYLLLYKALTAKMAGTLKIQAPGGGAYRRSGGMTDSLDSHKESAWVAAIAALIFVAHPVATGAVTYLIQRGVSLSAALGLFSILLYTYARVLFFQKGKRFLYFRHLLLYGLSFVLLCLALLTKEGALVFPLLLIGWELIFEKRTFNRSRVLYLLPFLLLLAIIPVISLTTAKSAVLQDDILYQINRPWNPVTVIFLDGGEGSYLSSSWEYFLTQCKSVSIYIRLAFFPVRQNFYYHLAPCHTIFRGNTIFLLLGYLSIIISGIKLVLSGNLKDRTAGESPRTDVEGSGDQVPTIPPLHHSTTSSLHPSITPAPISHRLIGAGILWFFIALIPTSSFLILWPFLSEFHLYISLAGLSFVWAGLLILPRKAATRRLIRSVLLLTVFAFALLAIRRNAVYSSAVTLWEDTVKKSPRLAPAHSNLAAAYIGSGNYKKAIKEAALAMELNHKFNCYRNLRTAYRARGELEKANELIEEEIERFPESYRGYYEKALTIINDDPGAGRRFLNTALNKNPPSDVRSRIILKKLEVP